MHCDSWQITVAGTRSLWTSCHWGPINCAFNHWGWLSIQCRQFTQRGCSDHWRTLHPKASPERGSDYQYTRFDMGYLHRQLSLWENSSQCHNNADIISPTALTSDLLWACGICYCSVPDGKKYILHNTLDHSIDLFFYGAAQLLRCRKQFVIWTILRTLQLWTVHEDAVSEQQQISKPTGLYILIFWIGWLLAWPPLTFRLTSSKMLRERGQFKLRLWPKSNKSKRNSYPQACADEAPKPVANGHVRPQRPMSSVYGRYHWCPNRNLGIYHRVALGLNSICPGAYTMKSINLKGQIDFCTCTEVEIMFILWSSTYVRVDDGALCEWFNLSNLLFCHMMWETHMGIWVFQKQKWPRYIYPVRLWISCFFLIFR